MILIVDDDASVRATLSLVLRRKGYGLRCASCPDEAVDLLRQCHPRLILMDMNYGSRTDGADGLNLLRGVKILAPEVPVILISAWGSIDLAVQGMRLGAADFITKPWNSELLLQRVATTLQLSEPDNKSDGEFVRTGIVGRSAALESVLDMVARIAPTDAPVLITGENGTGKELIARAIHQNSRRADRPFVAVNLGALPPALFESEMFGYVRGAFTGADADREGRVAMADGGTLFLDEIGELDAASQVKLLRVLQEHSYERLGESRARRADIRVVCATNADLGEMMRERTFREDLYYRISTISVAVPSLAQRRSDIPLLAKHFASELDANAVIADDALELLASLPYPGNVRQLRNIVARAVYLRRGDTVGADDVRLAFDVEPDASPSPLASGTLEDMEKAAVIDALRRNKGNLSAAASELGITRQSLYRRMEKFGLS